MSHHKNLLSCVFLVAASIVPQTAAATRGTIPPAAVAALKKKNVNVGLLRRNTYRSARLVGPKYDREGRQVPGHAFVVKVGKINYLLVQPHKGPRWEVREIAKPMRGTNRPSRNVTKFIRASTRPFDLAFASQGPATDAVVGITVRGARSANEIRGKIYATAVGPGNTVTYYVAPPAAGTIKTEIKGSSGSKTPVNATISQTSSSLRSLRRELR